MYPFGENAYPRNRWYIGAFSREITDRPFQRTLLDTPVVFYRTEAGQAVAMYGLCPHRYYPLARGQVQGDAIVCGYHGFTFSASGKCIRIPSQSAGADFFQRVYPLEERGFLTWIWMGDPALANPSLIPPYESFGLDQPGWTTSGGERIELKARMQLLIDNLMDLTHLPHIHHQIGGGDIMLNGRLRHQDEIGSFRLTQEMQSPWTQWHTELWGEQSRSEGNLTTHVLTDFYGPELIRVSGPLVLLNHGEAGARRYLAELNFMHGATPETAHSTHYWAFQTRNARLEDAEFERVLVEVDLHVRMQDVEAIQAIEETLERGASIQKELVARADRPSMLVRDKIRRMIDAEAGQDRSAV